MDPLFVAIAAALSGKAAGGLYDLVRRHLRKDRDALGQLDAVSSGDATPAAVESLAGSIQRLTELVPGAREQLEVEYARQTAAIASGDAVSNVIAGDASGSVVQARDVSGGINF